MSIDVPGITEKRLSAHPGGMWTVVGTYVLALLIGAVYGTLGTIGYRHRVSIEKFQLPWGLLVALIGVTALLIGVRLVAGGRWVAAATGVGVVTMIGVLSLTSPGGSQLMPAQIATETGPQPDIITLVWAYLPPVILFLIVVWPAKKITTPIVDASQFRSSEEELTV